MAARVYLYWKAGELVAVFLGKALYVLIRKITVEI